MVAFTARIPRLFSLLFPVFLLAGCERADSPPADTSAEIKALHEERIGIMKQLVKFTETQFAEGRAPSTNVLEAQRQLLTVQLEAATDLSQRIKLREELVDNLKRFEEQVSVQTTSGAAPTSNLLQIRAARLKAEIDLATEKQ